MLNESYNVSLIWSLIYNDVIFKPSKFADDELAREYDAVPLYDLLARHDLLVQDRWVCPPFTPTQRAAINEYHSAQLRQRVKETEDQLKARSPSVVIAIDADDL